MSESERSVNDSLEQVSEAPVDSFWEIGQYKVQILFFVNIGEYLPVKLPIILENSSKNRKWR